MFWYSCLSYKNLPHWRSLNFRNFKKLKTFFLNFQVCQFLIVHANLLPGDERFHGHHHDHHHEHGHHHDHGEHDHMMHNNNVSHNHNEHHHHEVTTSTTTVATITTKTKAKPSRPKFRFGQGFNRFKNNKRNKKKKPGSRRPKKVNDVVRLNVVKPFPFQIPRTGFSCKQRAPGYYADMNAECQVSWKNII